MSKRFMIVRRKTCCGAGQLNYVGTASGTLKKVSFKCVQCGLVSKRVDVVMDVNGDAIMLNRIIWLDDPDIERDTIQEIEDKLKV